MKLELDKIQFEEKEELCQIIKFIEENWNDETPNEVKRLYELLDLLDMNW